MLFRSGPAQRFKILNQIVELVLGHVVGHAVLVVGIVLGPDFLQGPGNAVVQVGGGVVDVQQVRRVELAVAVVGELGADVVDAAVGVERRRMAGVAAPIQGDEGAVVFVRALEQRFAAALGGTLWFVLGAVGPVALLLYYQWYCFGDPWLPAQFHMPKKVFAGYPSERGFGWPLPEALWGLLFHPQYGLLVFAPVFALALYHPVLVLKKRNRVPGRAALFAWLFFAALYVFCSMIHYTIRHQWQDGVRYIVPALPLLFLLVADVLSRMRRWVLLLITVLAVGESWALAMVRESPLESLRRVLAEGPQFPWLTTLEKTGGTFFPALTDSASPLAQWLPWGVVAAMLIGIALIWWIGPRENLKTEEHGGS